MNDLKFAFRQLLKNPGFTAVAVLTLALGIGANTAIFSVVNAVLLRSLPYPESDRLVFVSERTPTTRIFTISYPNFADWRAQQTVFEHIGVYSRWGTYNLAGAGDPMRLNGAWMSADAFAALRAQPIVGRVFNNDEDKPGAPNVVVLSHRLWQERFGGDPGILNQPVNLDGDAFTVIGVMPAEFLFPSAVDIWVPVGPLSGRPSWQSRGNHPGLLGVARLKPGVTLEQARAEMSTIATRLAQQYPDSNKDRGIHVEPLLDNVVGNASRALWMLLAAVVLVLLIACANVANLLLARAAARQREMAVRAALGAGRWRIVRQLLTESLLLATVGGALGLLLAHWLLGAILALSSDAIPRVGEIRLDGGVLAFTALAAFLTGVLFGLAPAWQASRPAVQEALKDTARGISGGRARLRHGLIVAEVALTLLLLVSAGLLLRSFYRLQTLNPGFSSERVLSFRLALPNRKYATGEQQIAFYQSLMEKLGTVPGVQVAAYGTRIPLAAGYWSTEYLIEGQPEPPADKLPGMHVTVASADYFRVLGIPLLKGRSFTDQDNLQHLRGQDLSGLSQQQRRGAGINKIIVDEEFARRHWPQQDPIGKRVLLAWGRRDQYPVLTVIGVVGRVRLNQLTEQGDLAQVYFSALQAPGGSKAIVLKTSLPPDTLITAVREQVRALDSEQPIYDLQTAEKLRSNSLAPQRLNLALLGLFAVMALALAVIGLYGVLAYAVEQRRRDIGIRMALGAQRGDVLSLVFGQGMRLVVAGILLGLASAFALTRLLQALLFETKPFEPFTVLSVSALLFGVALLACWLPARRATKVDPMEALRCE